MATRGPSFRPIGLWRRILRRAGVPLKVARMPILGGDGSLMPSARRSGIKGEFGLLVGSRPDDPGP